MNRLKMLMMLAIFAGLSLNAAQEAAGQQSFKFTYRRSECLYPGLFILGDKRIPSLNKLTDEHQQLQEYARRYFLQRRAAFINSQASNIAQKGFYSGGILGGVSGALIGLFFGAPGINVSSSARPFRSKGGSIDLNEIVKYAGGYAFKKGLQILACAGLGSAIGGAVGGATGYVVGGVMSANKYQFEIVPGTSLSEDIQAVPAMEKHSIENQLYKFLDDKNSYDGYYAPDNNRLLDSHADRQVHVTLLDCFDGKWTVTKDEEMAVTQLRNIIDETEAMMNNQVKDIQIGAHQAQEDASKHPYRTLFFY